MSTRYSTNATAPRIDIREQSDSWSVQAELPGVAPENISAEAKDDVLTIRSIPANSEEGTTEVNDGFTTIRQEWSTGPFERHIRLGRNADPQNIQANYEHGLLTLTIGKKQKDGPVKITIG